jgi:hypothetical protein
MQPDDDDYIPFPHPFCRGFIGGAPLPNIQREISRLMKDYLTMHRKRGIARSAFVERQPKFSLCFALHHL